MISDEITEINNLLRNQQRYDNHENQDYAFEEDPDLGIAPGITRSGTEDRRLYGNIFPSVPAWSNQDVAVGQYSRSPDIKVLIHDLPTQQQCVALIRAYLGGYHTVSPLFHSPSFWQQAREVFNVYALL